MSIEAIDFEFTETNVYTFSEENLNLVLQLTHKISFVDWKM